METEPRARAKWIGSISRWSQRTTVHGDARQRFLCLVAGCSVLAAVAWLEHRSLNRLHSAQQSKITALLHMRRDARRIAALSSVPQMAAEKTRANEELLGQVESALQKAGINAEKWLDSVPQHPQPLGDSSYRRVSTRLFLEDVTLERLTVFAHTLVDRDPSLSITALQLTAPGDDTADRWRVDLTVSYLVSK